MWLPIVGGRVGVFDGEMDGVAEGSTRMGSQDERGWGEGGRARLGPTIMGGRV
jgi:hypothetical protein